LIFRCRVSFVFQEALYSWEFLIVMGVASVILNSLSVLVMSRRGVARLEKGTYVTRCLEGYEDRKWDGQDIRPVSLDDPDTIDWSKWKWRPAEDATMCTCYHETWSAIEVALPRFALALAIIGVAHLVNIESVSEHVDH